MDSYREHPSDFDLPSAVEADAPDETQIDIGSDERRMHVRAYNYWVSLLNGRDYPSIDDLDPQSVADFAAHSVLLDFTAGKDNPATPYVGAAVREECGIDSDISSIAEIPSRSLLTRLTDHYLQIIANRAPVGFEAEFVNQREVSICYRGILMPFSSDGETIDFIYGVINWKQSEDSQVGQPAVLSDQTAASTHSNPEDQVGGRYEPSTDPLESGDDSPDQPPVVHFAWEDGPLADPETGEPLPIVLDEDAGLADRLWAARESAAAMKDADCRSRTALYRALSMAYDFALTSLAETEAYAELLEESGMKAQARAPMTPIVKLVFGIDYDKTRLTEFAAALCYAKRQGVEFDGFLTFIEGYSGGLKAVVAAERRARRPEPRPDTRAEAARDRLRQAPALSLEGISSESEFALVLARRSENGGVEPIAIVDDQAMVENAIRKLGR